VFGRSLSLGIFLEGQYERIGEAPGDSTFLISDFEFLIGASPSLVTAYLLPGVSGCAAPKERCFSFDIFDVVQVPPGSRNRKMSNFEYSMSNFQVRMNLLASLLVS